MYRKLDHAGDVGDRAEGSDRRSFLRGAGRWSLVIGVAGASSGCAAVYAERRVGPEVAVAPPPPPEPSKPDWRGHFGAIDKGAILVSLSDRRLAFWEPGGGGYNEFPIAVPRTRDLERRGLTKVVRRKKNPSWRPTPNMRKRNPNLPDVVGPGPHNPLGVRALYLGWQYFAIHGTNDPYSIGAKATSGCFRMFPQHIEWLYDRVGLGVPVRVVDEVVAFGPRSRTLMAVNDPTALGRQYAQRLAQATGASTMDLGGGEPRASEAFDVTNVSMELSYRLYAQSGAPLAPVSGGVELRSVSPATELRSSTGYPLSRAADY